MEWVATLKAVVTMAAYVAEGIGVAVILLGVMVALIRFAAHPRSLHSNGAYDKLRRELGRSIIIGLEFLVAADIVHTVVIERTLESVGLLAVIVAVRTALSFSLFVEVEGRWPWQPERSEPDAPPGPTGPIARSVDG